MSDTFYPLKAMRGVEKCLLKLDKTMKHLPEQALAVKEHLETAMRELNHAHETLDAMDIHSHYDLSGD